MDFYTSVERFGNNLLYRGYSGTERVKTKIPFRPTLFVRGKKEGWTNLDGQTVEPLSLIQCVKQQTSLNDMRT